MQEWNCRRQRRKLRQISYDSREKEIRKQQNMEEKRKQQDFLVNRRKRILLLYLFQRGCQKSSDCVILSKCIRYIDTFISGYRRRTLEKEG